MVYSPQQMGISPAGMKKKKNRFAPIIQEQAQQGIATKMVAQQKDQALQDEQWQFQQDTTNQELALQRQQMSLAEDQAKFQKKMGYAELGMGAVSTAMEVMNFFDLFG